MHVPLLVLKIERLTEQYSNYCSCLVVFNPNMKTKLYKNNSLLLSKLSVFLQYIDNYNGPYGNDEHFMARWMIGAYFSQTSVGFFFVLNIIRENTIISTTSKTVVNPVASTPKSTS